MSSAGAREAWRLIVTWDGAPGWNMALDEALLASTETRPTLRFYTWKPAALSLGYFQRWSELEENLRAAPGAALDTVIVRRFSGGGAIHHSDELTFSITAAATHALFRGEVRLSYERVHGLLARTFAALGAPATLRGAAPVASDRVLSGMCFHHSTPFDLVWDGRKGVGSAQRRTGGRVLHHGSIKLGASALEEGVATLRTHAHTLVAATLARALQARGTDEWRADFALEEPAPSEREHAERRAAFYTSPEFVHRR